MSTPLFGMHKRVLIDTSIWIYHFEQHPKFAEPAGLLDAAGLRARYRLRTSDAILLATGLQTGASLAVTNDEIGPDHPEHVPHTDDPWANSSRPH